MTREQGSKMKTMLVALIAAASLCPTPASADPAEDNDRRPCVTRTEQRLVDEGWRKRRVHRVFDTRGSATLARAETSAAIVRHYPACNGTHVVHVQYQSTDEDPKWRVTHISRTKR